MSSRESARRFHFIRPIASGGFGTVYLCKVVHADGFSRVVAVKLLNAQWSDSDDVTKRIRDEARLLGLLRHRNIVDVIDLTSIDGRAAVVMEYLEAVDLRYLLEHLRLEESRLPVRVALEIVAAVAGALDAAYNRPPMPGDKPLRVIHRDIKPSNIMLDSNGVPKVLDFGVAQSEIANREADTQELQFGSVEYMAPERLFFEPETPASDVYSLAVTLFELVAQEKLGKARGRAEKHAAQIVDRLSFLRAVSGLQGEHASGLEHLLQTSLHFEHEERPDAAEFSKAAKQLARSLDEMDLVNWSEENMPAAVEKSQSRSDLAEPLSDSILTEDSVAFMMEEGAASVADLDGMVGRETERAAALRRGALAEIQDSVSTSFSPVTGSPEGDGRGAVAPMGESTDGIGWNDRTMADLTDGTGEMSDSIERTEPTSEVERTDVAHLDGASIGATPEYETLDGLKVKKSRLPFVFMGLGGCLPLVIALGAGGWVVSQDIGGFRGRLLSVLGTESAESTSGAAEIAPMKASDTLATAENAPGIRFVSEWAGTDKIIARCDDAKGRGSTQAFVPLEAATQCSVTAIQPKGDLSRRNAVIDDVSVGTYICFEGTSQKCRRQ